ncbi:hemolymph lipopolysaccharide-binding protein [Anabrus simplex]|uniref:hemolymph lipopolysaccharide-binding protein n=1 Tax=Anabrus simplex TaxID=316456 RepID=UPI0034DD8B89
MMSEMRRVWNFHFTYQTVFLLLVPLVIISTGEAAEEVFNFNITSYSNPQKETGFVIDRATGPHDRISLDVTKMGFFCNDKFARISMGVSVTVKERGSYAPPDYAHIEGLGYYKFHKVPVTWLDAVINCAKEGGHMLVLNSEKEAEALRNFFAQNPGIVGADYTDYMHIGFHDLYREGEYFTITGEPLAASGYTRWAPGQPNANKDQNCASVSSTAELYDDVCSWKLAYVCEFPL